MDLGLPAGEIAVLVGALVVGGVLTGLLSGLFGVGGGGVMVPVLYELFNVLDAPREILMPMAVGTTFAVIFPTGLRSGLAHYRRGSLDPGLLKTLGPAVAAGVVGGLVVARYTGDTGMKIVWVFSAALIVLYSFFGDKSWRLGPQMPGLAVQVPVGAAVGFLATLMGVGGAAYLIPFMTLYGRPMHQAVGTAAGISSLIAIPAMLGYMLAGLGAPGLPPGSVGYVSLLGAALMMPASVLAAPLGVRMAHGLTRRQLELAFGTFISLVGLRFIVALAWG